MGFNKYDIAEKAGEGSTKEQLAKALGAETGSKEFAKAFENAASHDLISTQASDKSDPEATWSQTAKGKQKAADNA
ncbi:MAG: hypothetical protein H0U42_07300 [Thermoleophilaceae bacterium]|nr:hypothetical protein [Thermoleophilaceae bacterium]